MRRAFLTSVLIASVVIPLQGIADEPFGRLFFTPAQRNALDAGKQVRTRKAPSTPAMRGPREVTLNGVVTRSDGESTVWVNGTTLDKRNSGVSARAISTDPAAAELRVTGARNSVRMRVGQHLDTSNGSVGERYAQTGQARQASAPDMAAKDNGAKTKLPFTASEAAHDAASGN